MKRCSRFVPGCLVAVSLLIGFVQPARATDAFPGTDDHSTTTATAWWWYYGQTAQQVGDLVSQHNTRLTQIRVEDPSVPTFAVTMVANTGDYASSWWWYYGQTADQVGTLLNQHHARLISIDPYWTSGGLRFAVVMVPNTGAQERGWWWYYGQTTSQVGALLDQNNARLVALRISGDGQITSHDLVDGVDGSATRVLPLPGGRIAVVDPYGAVAVRLLVL